jgi:hypothetical protein
MNRIQTAIKLPAIDDPVNPAGNLVHPVEKNVSMFFAAL